MRKFNILIVEDTESDLESYRDTIRTLNKELIDRDVEIHAEYAKSKVDGLKMLDERKDELDGAFIDLKLQSGAPVDVNEGNDIVAQIYGKLRFPVVVLTNTPASFNRDFEESCFLQVKTKTDVQYRDVILDLMKIHDTGITRILGGKGIIETLLDRIFWDNIAHSVTEWIDVKDAEKRLLRHISSHLQEHLERSQDGNTFDTYLPAENYIVPGIRPYFFTGDIILKKGSDERFVILTPACDLAPHGSAGPKAKEVLVAELQPLTEGVFNDSRRNAKKEDDKSVEARKDLERLIQNTYSNKYYYLPDTTLIRGGLICFNKLTTVRMKDLKEEFVTSATITPQFVKDIVARFSYYYSRQGKPDFDFKDILHKYLH